jgi:uncharacterized protein
VQQYWLADPLTYTGDQLAPHWIYQTTGLLGDAVVGFTGAAQVDLSHMVDLEDVRLQAPIASQAMLHFVVELFDLPLKTGIALQRLWISAIHADIHQRTGGHCLTREGNDLWWIPERRKLSVAICTVSPTSVLMHLAFNLNREGAPVDTVGLESDLGLTDWPTLGQHWANLLMEEWAGICRSSWKVRAVL